MEFCDGSEIVLLNAIFAVVCIMQGLINLLQTALSSTLSTISRDLLFLLVIVFTFKSFIPNSPYQNGLSVIGQPLLKLFLGALCIVFLQDFTHVNKLYTYLLSSPDQAVGFVFGLFKKGTHPNGMWDVYGVLWKQATHIEFNFSLLSIGVSILIAFLSLIHFVILIIFTILTIIIYLIYFVNLNISIIAGFFIIPFCFLASGQKNLIELFRQTATLLLTLILLTFFVALAFYPSEILLTQAVATTEKNGDFSDFLLVFGTVVMFQAIILLISTQSYHIARAMTGSKESLLANIKNPFSHITKTVKSLTSDFKSNFSSGQAGSPPALTAFKTNSGVTGSSSNLVIHNNNISPPVHTQNQQDFKELAMVSPQNKNTKALENPKVEYIDMQFNSTNNTFYKKP